MDPSLKAEVQQIVNDTLKTSFTQKRIGDTPTDKLQLTPKKYVDTQVADLRVPRVTSIVTASSYTINTDTTDCFSIRALGGDINSIDASGTPSDFQRLIVRIKDNGSQRNLTWSNKFAEYGSTIPSVTTASKVLTTGFLYDGSASLWGCVAAQQQ